MLFASEYSKYPQELGIAWCQVALVVSNSARILHNDYRFRQFKVAPLGNEIH